MLRDCSARPGAAPATLTSTTGKPCLRNAAANLLAVLDHLVGRVCGRQTDDALLQIDRDESGFGIKGGDRHGFLLRRDV